MPVHPHARGDHAGARPLPHAPIGSPPRAWGSREISATTWPITRFTPTRVGITNRCPTPEQQTTVHPHARGDHAVSRPFPHAPIGSPPRAWGSRSTRPRACLGPWFTPTRVGITSAPRRRSRWSAVHPHARGDHRYELAPAARDRGSPARAWGSRSRRWPRWPGRWFTPTRVGITASATARRVYPPGSPPRAWGSPFLQRARQVTLRFTPTRVGITATQERGSGSWPVHPHARGDHAASVLGLVPLDGSPPRAWGSLQPVTVQHAVLRFTPTRVGITRRTPARDCLPPVHPHARGDHVKQPPSVLVQDGSPPRAWGSRDRLAGLPAQRRFTPTRVGITPSGGGTGKAIPVHPHARGDHRGCCAVQGS